MLQQNDIDKAIYNWITGFTGVSTIWRNENAPSPKLPYITLFILDCQPIGSHSFIGVDNNGYSTFVANNLATLQIDYYGKDGKIKLEELRYSMIDDYYRILLFNAGITILNFLMIRDLSMLEDSKIEQRFL